MGIYSQYENSFLEDLNTFKDKVNQFKKSTELFESEQNIDSDNRLTTIMGITISDQEKILKKYDMKKTCQVNTLEKIAEKKLLDYMAIDLEDKLGSYPKLNTSESAMKFLDEMMLEIEKKTSKSLETLDMLVQKKTFEKRIDLKAEVDLLPTLGESSLNAILKIPDQFFDQKQFEVKPIKTFHNKEINCVLSYAPNLCAIGSADMTISIWNTSQGSQITTLRGHKSAITALSSIKSYSGEVKR